MRRAQQVYTKEDSRHACSAMNGGNTHTTIKTTPSSFHIFPPLPGQKIPRRGADDLPRNSCQATSPLPGDGNHFRDESEASSNTESRTRSGPRESIQAQSLTSDHDLVSLPTGDAIGVYSVSARTLLTRNRFPPLPNETPPRDTVYDTFGRGGHSGRGKNDKSTGDAQNCGDRIEHRLAL